MIFAYKLCAKYLPEVSKKMPDFLKKRLLGDVAVSKPEEVQQITKIKESDVEDSRIDEYNLIQ